MGYGFYMGYVMRYVWVMLSIHLHIYIYIIVNNIYIYLLGNSSNQTTRVVPNDGFWVEKWFLPHG